MRPESVCPLKRRFYASTLWAGVLLGTTAPAAIADTRVLALAYSGPFGLDPNIHNLERNLLGPGYQVTFQWGADYGTLASYLGQATFDQVWIWDQLIGDRLLNDADKAALSAWYAAHPHIALDSRSTAIRAENDATETQLAHNIRDQFAAVGGGLWIGASAAPTYAATANSWLTYAGSGLFTGSYTASHSPLSGAAGHPFLADLDVNGLLFSLVGGFVHSAAPTAGPGGVPLQTVVWDTEGHALITTNIPEPATGLLVACAALVLCGRRRSSRTHCRGSSE